MAKAAFITGAAGGIGQALCQEFHAAGYQVLGSDHPSVLATEACEDMIPADLEALCHDDDYRQTVIDQVRLRFKAHHLAVLVNNAAIQVVAPVEKLTSAQWHTTLDVNLLAPFLLTQAFLTELSGHRGSVINIASIHAQLTKPEFSCYATSKAALVGLTRSLAVELGDRVRVNAIAPAAIATSMLMEGFEDNPTAFEQLSKMHPIGRIGTPEEVAKAALFLASDQARFMTGAILELDGGISGRLHDPV